MTLHLQVNQKLVKLQVLVLDVAFQDYYIWILLKKELKEKQAIVAASTLSHTISDNSDSDSEEIEALKKELEEKEKELNELREKRNRSIVDASESNVELANKLQELEKENEALKQELESLKQRLADLEAEKEEMERAAEVTTASLAIADGSKDPMDSGFGTMSVNGGSRVVVATDAYGNKCVDAFMMGIPLKSKINISQSVRTNILNNEKGEKYETNSFSSDTLVWWDCTAIVTINSERNLIATRVAGRDYSRKELVSNGDISISVSGRLNSFLPDVYPTNEMKKFIQIMNYKGAIRVKSQMLSMLGIDRIVIQNFNMPQKEGYKNIQEYTFTAIGMQPDKEIKVDSDTIVSIEQALIKNSDDSRSAWQKMLDKKLEGIKSASEDALAGGLSMASGMLQNSL